MFILCYTELTEGSIPMAIAISLYFSSHGCIPTQEGWQHEEKELVTKQREQSLVCSWARKNIFQMLWSEKTWLHVFYTIQVCSILIPRLSPSANFFSTACKRWKAGQGLGTRPGSQCFVYISYKLTLFPWKIRFFKQVWEWGYNKLCNSVQVQALFCAYILYIALTWGRVNIQGVLQSFSFAPFFWTTGDRAHQINVYTLWK